MALQAELRAKMGLKEGEAPPPPPPIPAPPPPPVETKPVVEAPQPLSLKEKLETLPDEDLSELAKLNNIAAVSRDKIIEALTAKGVEV
jgi:hypothetical protein